MRTEGEAPGLRLLALSVHGKGPAGFKTEDGWHYAEAAEGKDSGSLQKMALGEGTNSI